MYSHENIFAADDSSNMLRRKVSLHYWWKYFQMSLFGIAEIIN
jgi:hypothetical protein